MPIEINRYLEARNPPRPLELFPEGVLLQMLDGFCLYVQASVAILHPRGDKVDLDEVATNAADSFHRLEDDAVREAFHPFCREFRRCPHHEQKCCEFDAQKAAEYWRNSQKGLEKYECHMGLVDMAYPLRLRGQMVAAVFAGQMMTEDAVPRIKERVRERATPGSQLSLFELLEHEEECPRHTDDEVASAFRHFENLGRMLQDLLDRLYNQQWDAARREFLSDVARELILVPGETGEWSETLNYVLDSFLQLTGLLGIKVYSRRHSRYELWGVSLATGQPPEDERPMRVKYVAPLPDASITPIETLRDVSRQPEDFNCLQRTLSLGNQDITLFLHKYGEESTLFLDTLVALSGTWVPEDGEFIKDFCETVAMRTETARLVSALQEERNKFTERVGHVGHSTKIPLQNAVMALEDLKGLAPRAGTASNKVNHLAALGVRNIRIAKLYLHDIYTPPTTEGKPKELRGLLQDSLERVQELAKEWQCKVVLDVEEFFIPMVRAQSSLLIAFTNLLDNATTYSNPGGSVAVRLRSFGPDTALVEVENKGQGIPESQIGMVRASHVRWVPPDLPDDLRRRRQGAGLGLAMAIECIENHGGWLEIRSSPDDPRYRDDPSNRWTTTVTVGLPVVK